MSLLDKKELPIGVFDSGVGGLTVLHALQHLLPHEHFLYLGDTARLPYGTKSPQTVKSYTLNANEILISRGIKALVVACNTASAVALEALQERFQPLPIIGVVLAGAKACLTQAPGPIVVLATEGTVKWHAYRQILTTIDPGREVIEWPCSLLVALAEEGWCHGSLVEQIIIRLLSPLMAAKNYADPAGVLLGCTHFPVFTSALQNVMGQHVPVIDPAHHVAKEVLAVLSQQDLLRQSAIPGLTRFMATDGVERFAKVAQIFLEQTIAAHQVELVAVPLNEKFPANR